MFISFTTVNLTYIEKELVRHIAVNVCDHYTRYVFAVTRAQLHGRITQYASDSFKATEQILHHHIGTFPT